MAGAGASADRAGREAPLSEFDDDTALEAVGPGKWAGCITERWSVGPGPNGGYLAAIITRGLLAEAPMPQPLSMTIHYVDRPVPGPVRVSVEVVRVGRAHATLSARLEQDQVVAAALCTVGRHREGDRELSAPAPPYPPPEQCTAPAMPEVDVQTIDPAYVSGLRQRVTVRVAEPADLYYLREGTGPPLTRGWTRLADGRPTDDLVVPLLLDSFPPAVFSALGVPAGSSGVPTIELTVHWRSRPHTPWHLASFTTRFLSRGYMEEDGELWGEDGVLVAQSRQLARFRAQPPG